MIYLLQTVDARLKADAAAIPLSGSLFFSAAVEMAAVLRSAVAEAVAAVWIAAGSSFCSYCAEMAATGAESADWQIIFMPDGITRKRGCIPHPLFNSSHFFSRLFSLRCFVPVPPSFCILLESFFVSDTLHQSHKHCYHR